MARFLFVVPPLVGHVNPTVSVAAALATRGHGVAWVGHRAVVGGLLADDATLFPVGDDEEADRLGALREQGSGLRGVRALQFLWEDFLLPLGDRMVQAVDDAVERFCPDVLVVDQQAIAGAVVARRRDLAWATSATTPAELVDTLDDLPAVAAWITRSLVDFQVAHGIDRPSAEAVDLRFSDRLVVAFTTRELVGARDVGPAVAFVGPSFRARPETTPFPWDRLERDRPHVLVTLGTVNAEAGQRFFSVAAEAFDGSDAQAVFVAPPDRFVGPVPDNVLVRPFVPQVALLDHMDAVVCHAGHNTVCETLAHGLPLVVAPIRDDQPVVAEQVVRAGAGIRVKFGRVRAGELRSAVDTVLADPRFRAAAQSLRQSFDAAGGADAAARHLEALVDRDRSGGRSVVA